MKKLLRYLKSDALSAYVLRRLAAGLVTIFCLVTITFFGMHAVPGDPIASEKMPEATKAAIKAKYHLDEPLMVQYGLFLKNLSQGDLGISFTKPNRTVNDEIRDNFWVSAKLGILALGFALVGGILFGSIAALWRNRLPDITLVFLVIIGISVPGFVFATFAQMLIMKVNFITALNWPIAGSGSLRHLIVPSFILGMGTMAFITRLMRSSMLEVTGADYIRTAKAKGLSPLRIFFSHQLRNAILPVITILGPAIAGITTGSFVIETVFSIPGLGRTFVEAVQQNDYTMILGTTTFFGAFLILMVLLVDLLYGVVDPRIRVNS